MTNKRRLTRATTRSGHVCVVKKEMRKRGCEGQGTVEACVIVLPLSFDRGSCSCYCLEHLYLIRGKWVVREKQKKTSFTLISFFHFFFTLFCIIKTLFLLLIFLLFVPAFVTSSACLFHPASSFLQGTSNITLGHNFCSSRPKLPCSPLSSCACRPYGNTQKA